MRTVRRVTKDTQPDCGRLLSSVLVGEETLLRVGRSGFGISYAPLPQAQWRDFPPAPEAEMEALLQDECAAVFAAYEGEKLIGVASVRETARGWGELLDIRVDAAYRRTGAARMLLDACDRFCAGRGMHGMRLEASEANPALCQFCEHTGFHLHGVDRMALIYTETEMQKPMARRACALLFYKLCGEDA